MKTTIDDIKAQINRAMKMKTYRVYLDVLATNETSAKIVAMNTLGMYDGIKALNVEKMPESPEAYLDMSRPKVKVGA